MSPVGTHRHLPPHLAEVCDILARGLVRLRRRTAEEFCRDAGQSRGQGESSLHFLPDQSVHATRQDGRPA